MRAATAGRGAGVVCALALLATPSVGRAQAPASDDGDAARALSRAFVATVRAVGGAIVRVERARPVPSGPPGMAASGVVLDTAGHILTMARVEDGTVPLSVVFADGARLPARVVGTDWLTGISVVRLERVPTGIDAARFGDSDLVDAGDWALALARPDVSDLIASAGIVEGRAVPRIISPVSAPRGRGYLRIGALIDGHGHGVGGALVNLDGEVVGLCAGRGLAIPINQARRAAQMIVTDGRAHYPYMGVTLRDLDALDRNQRIGLGLRAPLRGALVSRIWDGAPAERAGLRAGDVITAIDNQETPDREDVVRTVALHAVGEILTVAFVRGASERSARIALGDLPPAGGQDSEREVAAPPGQDPVLAAAIFPPCGPSSMRSGRAVGDARSEDDLRDLGGGGEPHRRTPVARPAADVDLRAAVAVKPGHERLLKADEQAERPDLSAVRVARQL